MSSVNSRSRSEIEGSFKVPTTGTAAERVAHSFERGKAQFWDSPVMREAVLISADNATGKMVFEMTIKSTFCNARGRLHGGAATTILDDLSSMVIQVLARPGFMERGSVSRTLTMTFFRPVAMGTKVRIECELESLGKMLCNVKARIKTIDGKVCVSCVHDKAIVPTPKL